MKINWNYPTSVWVGENRIKDLPEACKNLSISRPLFVTDKDLINLDMTKKIILEIKKKFSNLVIFSNFSGNPIGENVEEGVLEFKSGAISTITTSMNQPFRCHMNIDLTGGRIEIPNMFDDSGPIIIRKGTNDDLEEKVLKVESKYRFVSQINEFSDCIIKNINPTYPPEDGLMNTATINALYKSATENKKIVVKSS